LLPTSAGFCFTLKMVVIYPFEMPGHL
jgi:hypothetical protein